MRVSYPDMIGVDRGRDVLIDQLGAATEHGAGTLPRDLPHHAARRRGAGAGGLEAGLPDITVYPVLATITPLPWEPNAAWCLGDAFTTDGERAPESPRTVAATVADRLTAAGYRLVCGPELEFFVCEQGPDGRCAGTRTSSATSTWSGARATRRACCCTCCASTCGTRSCRSTSAANHEFSAGQFEINLGHSDLLDAADRAFRLKSAVQEIARLQGLLAAFMAKPFNDEGGSGFHLHVSLADDAAPERHRRPRGRRRAVGGRAARAGRRAGHAPALSALLNPTINSYKRFGPDTLAPWLIDWGLDNRSAMVRIPPERGDAARLEIRLGDATANPYLVNAAVGAAAYLGIQDKAEPPAKLEGYGYDPASAQLLPQRLSTALDALEGDTELADVLGSYFVTSFLSYKRNEIERFERYVTDWEFGEYAYHL